MSQTAPLLPDQLLKIFSLIRKSGTPVFERLSCFAKLSSLKCHKLICFFQFVCILIGDCSKTLIEAHLHFYHNKASNRLAHIRRGIFQCRILADQRRAQAHWRPQAEEPRPVNQTAPDLTPPLRPPRFAFSTIGSLSIRVAYISRTVSIPMQMQTRKRNF